MKVITWHVLFDLVDAGGFFLALLEHAGEGAPLVAQTSFASPQDLPREAEALNPPPPK